MDGPSRPTGRRGAIVTVAGFGALVTLMLLSLSLRADERFHPYHYGSMWSQRPWRAITYPLEVTPNYLELGNFRPVGRILEHLNFLAQYRLFLATGLPMNVVLGLVRVASVVLLGMAVVWFAQRLTVAGPRPEERSSLPLLAALAFPGLVTYTGNLSSLVIFSGLYFQSVALALVVAGLFASAPLYRSERLAPLRLAGFVALGAVAAATNELVYLGVVVAAVVVLLQARRFSLSPRGVLRSAAGRASVAAGAGFLAVFVPSRLWIWQVCRGPAAACYDASEVSLSGWSPSLFGARVFAGSPLRTWWSLRSSHELTSLAPRVALVLLVAVLVVLLAHRRGAPDHAAGAEDASPSRRVLDPATLTAIVAGLALVVGAALLASLSSAMQESLSRYLSWRESPVAIAGWALLLAGLVNLVVRRFGWNRLVVVGVAATAAIAMALSLASNVARQGREHADPRSLLSDRTAVETASFDRSDEGDARRCQLLAEFDELHDDANQLRRLRRGLDATAQHRFGTDFCTGGDHG